MAEVIIIVAVSENGIIGKDNRIPWHISEDLQRFKRLTMGFPVIMGRRTWESLNGKPLPGRKNIVLTRQRQYRAEYCHIFHSFEDAMASCRDFEKVFILGGNAIFTAGLEIADTIELTRVHRHVEGDVSFPDIDFNRWQKVYDEKKDGFSFITYHRKK